MEEEVAKDDIHEKDGSHAIEEEDAKDKDVVAEHVEPIAEPSRKSS